jgi:hypothetical protein
MSVATRTSLIQFLIEDLEIPTKFINLALDRSQSNFAALPMVLWQYGIINLQQLEKILDRSETIY